LARPEGYCVIGVFAEAEVDGRASDSVLSGRCGCKTEAVAEEAVLTLKLFRFRGDELLLKRRRQNKAVFARQKVLEAWRSYAVPTDQRPVWA